jgi:hypothetical protein
MKDNSLNVSYELSLATPPMSTSLRYLSRRPLAVVQLLRHVEWYKIFKLERLQHANIPGQRIFSV